ncbi:MAG: ABC transporter permease [Chloroflexi bacterium]|nr:ABC transporter permease [Chloroflexota bacterium]
MTFVLSRLVRAVLTVFGALTLVFLSLRLTPGDPVEIMLGDYRTPELVAILRAQYGLDRPLPVQYLVFVKNTLTGDFGMSLAKRQDVSVIIGAAWPYTVALALASMVVTCIIGIPLGTIAALKRNTWADFSAMVISLLGVAMPGFLMALLMIYLFAYWLGWFPVQGAGEGRGVAILGYYLVLPSVALGFQSAALVARTTRASLLAVLDEDYMRTARAKGLSEAVILQVHAYRNALVPILAVLGLFFGQLLGGAAVAEIVFGRPGLGKLLVDSILSRDYPLSQALISVFLMGVILVNFVTDTLYGLADPRIRRGT